MRVQDILTDESKWTQNLSAVDMCGEEVDIFSPNAVAFCLWGALERGYDGDDSAWQDTYRKIEAVIGPQVAKWNDAPSRTFAEVRALVEELDI